MCRGSARIYVLGPEIMLQFSTNLLVAEGKNFGEAPSHVDKKIQTPSHVGKKYESPSPPGHRTSLRIFFIEMEFSRLFNACHSHCSMMMCKLIGAIINLYTVTRIDYDSQTISISLTKNSQTILRAQLLGETRKQVSFAQQSKKCTFRP